MIRTAFNIEWLDVHGDNMCCLVWDGSRGWSDVCGGGGRFVCVRKQIYFNIIGKGMLNFILCYLILILISFKIICIYQVFIHFLTMFENWQLFM